MKTDGARIEITFLGVEAGIFSGSLQYTVYRGSNLLRQEVIAKTNEPSVAYKYVGGLKGFGITDNTTLVWRDTARGRQHYGFGGAVNTDPVGLRARNRLAILETNGGSLAVFPRRTSSSSREKSKRISVTCTTAKTATAVSQSEYDSLTANSERNLGVSRMRFGIGVWARLAGT